MFCIHDDNHCESEKILIDIFKTKFIQRTDIGIEYFEGELLEMVDIIYKHCTDQESFKVPTQMSITWKEMTIGEKITDFKKSVGDTYECYLLAFTHCNEKLYKYFLLLEYFELKRCDTKTYVIYDESNKTFEQKPLTDEYTNPQGTVLYWHGILRPKTILV